MITISPPLARAKDRIRLGIATLRVVKARIPTSEVKDAIDALYRAIELIEQAEKEAPRAH